MQNNQIQNLIDYSKKMLNDARNGSWDEVFEYEQKRRALLEKLFSTSGKPIEVTEMDNKIREVIAINSKLEAITKEARDNAHNSLVSLGKGRRALDSYAKNT